jgi:hypothetical protein
MGEGLGFKTFVTGDVLTAADTNGYLMQGVWVFANAAARDAAVTSPQEGNMCYLKDTNVTQYYSGSAWAAVGAPAGLTFITGASYSAVSSVSLPANTFTSTYLNYKIIFNNTAVAGAITETRFRLRASGTDDTTANYSSGGTEINYAGGGGASNTNAGTYILWGNTSSGQAQDTQFEITMFSPQASTKTVFNVNGGKGTLTWKAMTGFFSLTTSFDSMSFIADAGTMTGSYKVYGIANS